MTTSQGTPRVTGRHRNRALAAARRRRAVALALSGATYQDIAEEMGYASRGTVYRIVQQALARAEAETVDELRRLEVERLDSLQSTFWERAMSGELEAATIVLKVLDRRCRLQGLLPGRSPGRPATEPGSAAQVIVDPADIVACQGWPAEGWTRIPADVAQD